jgi:hypothetical protein
MEHRVFSTYYQNCLDGKADPIVCINKEHDSPMVPFWNSLEDRTEFRCFIGYCDYKVIPGLAMYEKMMKNIYYAE